MDTTSIAVAGFSVVSAVILFFTHALLINLPNKSAYSVLSSGLLLAALTDILIFHFLYFRGGPEPLLSVYYRLGLFVAPSAFYFFGRWVILPNQPFRPLQLLHLLPIPLLFLLRQEIALPLLFLSGSGYSLWLGNIVYGLRGQRRQFRFEFFFFATMSAIAVLVLILGFSIPYIDHRYFYYFYCNATGLAFAIVIVAMVANPDLLAELAEAARVKYSASTLREIDVEACLKKLESLMTVSKIYQNEDLSLASLATDLGLSSHQLSELVNTRLGMGFSKYIRERRVAAAKALLVSAPSQSILSISMD